MPHFVARPISVEAHRFDGDTAFLPDPFRLAVRRRLPNGTVEIMTGDGVRNCKYHDWIVRGPDGDFSVMRAAAFETHFEERHANSEPLAGDVARPGKSVGKGR